MPLTKEKFNALQLVCRTKGESDESKLIASWTYERYLKVREALEKSFRDGYGIVCTKDTSHVVKVRFHGVIWRDAMDGAEWEDDTQQDDHSCTRCPRGEDNTISYASLDEFEELLAEEE